MFFTSRAGSGTPFFIAYSVRDSQLLVPSHVENTVKCMKGIEGDCKIH